MMKMIVRTDGIDLIHCTPRLMLGFCLLWFFSGCSSGEGVRTITVRTFTPDGAHDVAVSGFGLAFSSIIAAETANAAGARSYQLQVCSGSVFIAKLCPTGPKDNRPPSKEFLFLYDGANLRLSLSGPVLMESGKPLALDLSDPDSPAWLHQAGREGAKSLRGVKLSGNMNVDLPALVVLGDLRAAVLDLSAYEELNSVLVGSVAATHPAALIVGDVPGRDELLAWSVGLRLLCTSGSMEGLSPVLPTLEALVIIEDVQLPIDKSGRRSLAFLKAAPQLRELVLEYPDASVAASGPATAASAPHPLPPVDMAPLAELKDLCVLSAKWKGQTTVAPLQPLTKLHRLTLSNCNDLHDVSGLAQIKSLAELTLIGLPKDVRGLEELAALPKLTLLVLDKDTLKHQSAQVNELKRRRPDLRVEGFCMGSWWILLILPAGLAAGLACRGKPSTGAR